MIEDLKLKELKGKRKLEEFWSGKGFVLWLTASAEQPSFELKLPVPPVDISERWLDLEYKHQCQLYQIANTYFGGDSFPIWGAYYGPGSLALILGSQPAFHEDTVWYEPCINEPLESDMSLQFSYEWYHRHTALIEKAISERDKYGYTVGLPDLIENLDILASLRGTQNVLIDLIEHPDFCKKIINHINKVFFQVFDQLYRISKDEKDGNAWCAFSIWGPGKTAKVQCDFSAMISSSMFIEFVLPSLSEQCDWLDYSLYHLDGQDAFCHLPALCKIKSLDAIEFTPRTGTPDGGDSYWFPVYRKIKEAGKRVQAVSVKPDEVMSLIEAVGSEGLFIICNAKSEKEAKELEGEIKNGF